MKKATWLLFLLAVSVLLFQGPAQAQAKFGFKLTGGLGYYGAGDLNTGLQGWSDILSDIYKTHSASGGYSPVHLGVDFNGEFFLQLNPELAIGLGVGYLSASKSSALELTKSGSTVEDTWSPKIGAIPVTLNLHYYLPLAGEIRLSLDAGLGYYFGTCTDTQHIVLFGEMNRTYDMTAGGIGFHGGLGLEIPVAPAVSIVVEARGRYASLGGFKGTGRSGSSERTGDVWLADITDARIYTLIDVYDDTPSGDNARPAKLDFSGFSATAGFLFRFGGGR